MDELEDDGATSHLLSTANGGTSPTADMQQWLHAVLRLNQKTLATLIYTSGTTGEPKGVMLTHGNIASNLNYSTPTFAWDTDSSCISFLPLSHITARHLDYALFCKGATLAYCGNFDRLPAALAAVKPTVFVAVPRVYEKNPRSSRAAQSASKPTVAKLPAWALNDRQAASRRNSFGSDALLFPLALG